MPKNMTSFETFSSNESNLAVKSVLSPFFFSIIMVILANVGVVISYMYYRMYSRKLEVSLAQHGHSIWSSNPSHAIIEKRNEYVRSLDENEAIRVQGDFEWSPETNLCTEDGIETVSHIGNDGSLNDNDKDCKIEMDWITDDSENKLRVSADQKSQNNPKENKDRFRISHCFSCISLFHKGQLHNEEDIDSDHGV